MSSTPFYHGIDFVSNAIQNVTLHGLASDPGSPAERQIWVNNTSGSIKVKLGSGIEELATVGYVQAEMATAGTGDMLKSVYDPNDDGKVLSSGSSDTVPWAGITGKPSEFTPTAHGHAIADTTGLQAALDAKLDDSQANSTGLSLLGAGTAGAARSTLGLGNLATRNTVDTAQLDNGSVTNLKLAGQPTNTIIGRIAAGSGLPDYLTAAEVKTLLSLVVGDIPGLQTAIDGKSDTGHGHTASDISDLTAEVQSIFATYWNAVAGGDDEADTLRETLTLVLQNRDDIANRLKRKTETIGNGSATTFAITHSFATKDIVFNVRSTVDDVMVGVHAVTTSDNVLTLDFGTYVPASGEFRVTIFA